MWAAEEKASEQLIGRIGLYQPPHFPDLEVNWLLGRAWWGKGLAREGAEACMAHAFGALDRTSVSAFIEAGNERSIGLAARWACAMPANPGPAYASSSAARGG